MAKTNIADIIKYPEFFLKITAVWPTPKPSYFYKLREMLTWIMSLFLYVVMVIEIAYEYKNFLELSPVICIFLSANAYIIKLVAFSLKKKKLVEIVNMLMSPVFSSYNNKYDFHMQNAVYGCTLLGKVFLGCCVPVVMQVWLNPLLNNGTYPIPFPIDLEPFGPLFYLGQVAGFGYAVCIYPNFDLLAVGFMWAALAHFNILHEEIIHSKENVMDMTENCGNDELDVMLQKELKKCVKYHHQIIEFVKSIEDVFSFSLLVQFSTSMLAICTTGFGFLLISPASPQFSMLFFYLIAVLTQLSMYCWFGNEIMLKSSKIEQACYELAWYECSPNIRKYLVIIMQRSKRPTIVTAFNYATLSLRTFATIMQWSYSYFTLMQRMYSKQQAQKHLEFM